MGSPASSWPCFSTGQAAACRLGLALLVLCALTACRREPVPPKAASPTATAPASEAVSATGGGAAPTTRALAPRPPDPGGCLASECHQKLVQVAFRHGPLQAGACDACHEPEQEGHKFPLLRAGVALCTNCHQVTGTQSFLHAVIAQQGCLPCHNPHGSDTRFLLPDATVELTCGRCHVTERKSHLHAPFASGQCTTCHQPHESNNQYLLVGGAGAEHCLTCHAAQREQLAAAHVHKPLTEGCVRCHVAHSGDYPRLLTAPVEKLCFECHTELATQVASASSPHGAVLTGNRCGNCHDPHAGDRPFLLRGDLRTLCLKCHDRPQQAYDGHTIPDMRPVLSERKFLHGPVMTGECNACHDVHGTTRARLLRKRFPVEFYESFELAKYALCFDCHNQALVLEPQTTSLTNFREGEKNLHYVHVNRPEKGRTCRTCHEIHGSNLPRHMASTVPFEGGGWPMSIGFEPLENGGRCSPGCHKPREYWRIPTPASVPTSTSAPASSPGATTTGR